MITWMATVPTHTLSGESGDRVAAWAAATAAAVDLCAVTAGRETVALAVGSETARLTPATDDGGQLDLSSTREACAGLVELVVDETREDSSVG